MKRLLGGLFTLVLMTSAVFAFERYCFYWPLPPDPGVGDTGRRAKISGLTPYNGSTVDVYFSQACAGCVSQVIWDGFKYENNWGDGRMVQMASSYGNQGECNNPTHAGSSFGSNWYGIGPNTWSELTAFGAYQNQASIVAHPAYWLGPGEISGGCHGLGPSTVAGQPSDDVFVQAVSVGDILPNVIKFTSRYIIKDAHPLTQNYEFLAFYTNPDLFFWYGYDPINLILTDLNPIPEGTFKQTFNNVASVGKTADGSHAIGIISAPMDFSKWTVDYADYNLTGASRPQTARDGSACCGNQTTKTHCQTAEPSVNGSRAIPANTVRTFICYVVVGTFDNVLGTLQAIAPTLPLINPYLP